MKQTLILAILALSIVSASCRKTRTCECKTTETEVISGFGERTEIRTYSDKITKDKQRKKAFKYSQNCFSEKYSYTDEGGGGTTAWSSVTTVETNCELK
ncbi:MAG: hypothetical protein JNL60_06555 [Bacteroidia bacterium]|nr:hypothetical protein [Bacteroidia bacterium]